MNWVNNTCVQVGVSGQQNRVSSGRKSLIAVGVLCLATSVAFTAGMPSGSLLTLPFGSTALRSMPVSISSSKLDEDIMSNSSQESTISKQYEVTSNPFANTHTSATIILPKETLTEKPVMHAMSNYSAVKFSKPKIDNVAYKKGVFAPKPRKQSLDLQRNMYEKKLFGSAELHFANEKKIKAWSSVHPKLMRDVSVLKACLEGNSICTNVTMSEWAEQLRPLQHASRSEKITVVHTLVNQRTYTDDKYIYGKSDYWASPSEFLTKNGDCEDFAILKFASLLALGLSNQDMRLVVGTLPNGVPHAILTIKEGSSEIVLDNRRADVYVANNRFSYIPKYSMNLTDRWTHIMPKAKTA